MDRKYNLKIMLPQGGYNEVPINDGETIVIGRKYQPILRDCEHISRDHVKITLDGNSFIVEDVSSNGTKFNGVYLNKGQIYAFEHHMLEVLELPDKAIVQFCWRLLNWK